MQPENWKISNKPRIEELTNFLSALKEIEMFPHSLTRHLVQEIFRQCQSSVSDNQATSPKRNKTNYNYINSMVEVSRF